MLLCTVCAGKATASSILYTSGYSVLIWGLIGGLGQVSQGPGVIKWELFNSQRCHPSHCVYMHTLTLGKCKINQFSVTLLCFKQIKLLLFYLSCTARGNWVNATKHVEPQLHYQVAEPLVSLLVFVKAW